MRTKDEIKKDGQRVDLSMLEVLLDIREYLSNIDAKTVVPLQRVIKDPPKPRPARRVG